MPFPSKNTVTTHQELPTAKGPSTSDEERHPFSDGSAITSEPNSDEEGGLSPSPSSWKDQIMQRRQHRRRGRRQMKWLLVGVLFVATNLLSGLAGAGVDRWRTNLTALCAGHTSQYCTVSHTPPVIKDVDIKYRWQNFNGSFMNEDVFRKARSPEVDAAWESMGVNYKKAIPPPPFISGMISYKEGIKSGLTDAHVQRSEKHGGGFFVNVEGLHHLHCLKLGKGAFSNSQYIVQLHALWYYEDETQSSSVAFPDFKTQHRCKNYNDIRDWAGKYQEPPAETLSDDYAKSPKKEHILAEMP
ncbi:hypothetical protein B0H63DRAFT_450107 [Podospora didyma]|uniref:Tat pathway signal sequence n=1 Tax=Podospora didyma TaxID=330526 RepID=A0AAE0U055_9PEZI|nr:hypothetical protein B0H63DRAFT_450107 [Podospora didyma]